MRACSPVSLPKLDCLPAIAVIVADGDACALKCASDHDVLPDHAMKPEIEVFGIAIKTFGVMFALGFIACGAVVARRLRELGRPVDWAYETTFAALLGGA